MLVSLPRCTHETFTQKNSERDNVHKLRMCTRSSDPGVDEAAPRGQNATLATASPRSAAARLCDFGVINAQELSERYCTGSDSFQARQWPWCGPSRSLWAEWRWCRRRFWAITPRHSTAAGTGANSAGQRKLRHGLSFHEASCEVKPARADAKASKMEHEQSPHVVELYTGHSATEAHVTAR